MGTVIGHPIRFAWDNHVTKSGTIVSATNEVVSLPWSNLKNHIPRKIGRSSSVVDPFYINFTFDSARTVQQFAMVGHSFAGSTLTLQGCTDSGFSPEDATVGVTYSSDILVAEFSSEQTYQYWRLRVVPHPSLTEIQAGHAFLGPLDEFDFPDFSSTTTTVDPSVRVRSYDGSATVFEKTQYRVVSFSLSAMDQADRRSMESIFTTIGTKEAFYLFLDPTNKRDDQDVSLGLDGLHRMTMLGFLTSPLSFGHIGLTWQRPSGFAFEESI